MEIKRNRHHLSMKSYNWKRGIRVAERHHGKNRKKKYHLRKPNVSHLKKIQRRNDDS
jgi:hypothetical protein